MLAMLQPGQVTDPLHAYQISKCGNLLRVMAEAENAVRGSTRS